MGAGCGRRSRAPPRSPGNGAAGRRSAVARAIGWRPGLPDRVDMAVDGLGADRRRRLGQAGRSRCSTLGALIAAVLLLRAPWVQAWVEPVLAAGAVVVVGYGLSERLVPGAAALHALRERPGTAPAAAHVLERDGRTGRPRLRSRRRGGRKRGGARRARAPPPRRRLRSPSACMSPSPAAPCSRAWPGSWHSSLRRGAGISCGRRCGGRAGVLACVPAAPFRRA